MTIKYLKKSPKTSSTDDLKTREIVQNLLSELEKSREEGEERMRRDPMWPSRSVGKS